VLAGLSTAPQRQNNSRHRRAEKRDLGQKFSNHGRRNHTMRRNLFLGGVIVALSATAAALAFVQRQPQPAKQAPPAGPSTRDKGKARPAADRSADEAAIRANIAKFVKAYNAGDAKAVAALFAPDGQVVDKQGNTTEGRDAIARTFEGLFEESPGRRIEVSVESIHFIGAELAVEVGTTKETSAPAEPPEYDRYTVLHVKRDGKWQMALARDEEGPVATGHERLRPLAWLVGDWVDDGGSTVVSSSCRWSKDGNFLLQDFKLQVNGRAAMDVSQRIGWDPLTKRVRAWYFDSEGGYGESVWTRDGSGWIIRATGVRPDGTTASATNLLTPAGKDGYVWRSTDRVVGDERQPTTEVRVIRKLPRPQE
jgi:uncharacterized protein (TIGR02246 family)